MVLRKQAPPRLDYTDQGNGRPDTRTSTSPTATAPSPSPKRLTRSVRARSSPRSPRFPSQESVYSPDLNTSPAFDLMPLEQAQKSPKGTSVNDNQNPWADELVERPDQDHQGHGDPRSHPVAPDNDPHGETELEGEMAHRVPSIVVAGTQRRMAANEWKSSHTTEDSSVWQQPELPPVQLQSNNPFLKARPSESNPWENNQDANFNGRTSLAASSLLSGDGNDQSSQNEGYIPMTARLSLLDEPASESPWAEERPNTTTQPPEVLSDQQPDLEQARRVSQTSYYAQVPMQIFVENGQVYHTPGSPRAENPPAIMLQPSSPNGGEYHYPPQQPQTYGVLNLETGIDTPAATLSSATPSSSADVLDLDVPPRSEAQIASPRAASSVYESDTSDLRGDLSQIQSSESAPPLPERPNVSQAVADSSAEQPSQNAPISEAEARQQTEQRSETYSIRHINWTDATGKLRESPVLVQNLNGPCPLLALVNALVLRAPQDAQPPIVKALQTREHISLGLLIQALFDELTTRLGPEDELPDIEALSRFLTMLHTGMNVNPRLTLESNDAVGSFLQTSDNRLYSTFGIPLVHGWVASPSSEAHAALVRVAQYHEDIQLLQFRKDELEDRVVQGGSLTSDEEQLMKDIQTIQHFVDIENATQLSSFGLHHLTESLAAGSVSILFRNDHFSTLYKHPQSHQLYTLVTDAGYSGHAEVVWESLVDVTGFNAEFFAGDFRPVGHAPPGAGAADPSGPRTSSNAAAHAAIPSEPKTNLSAQEQSDADYAYALALQFQEEERREESRVQARNRRASTPYHRSEQAHTTHNRSSSTVTGSSMNRYAPTAERRSSRQNQHPGRESQSRVESAAAKPSHNPDDGPPPPYEQAQASRPYVPPQGGPNPAGPYQDNRYSRQQFGRRPPGASVGPGTPQQAKDRKDCVVM